MPDIAYQLYCSRNFPPLSGTLSMLAAEGYGSVEGYGGLFHDVDGLKSGLEQNGLRMISSHFGLDQLEEDADGVIAIAKSLGIQKVFVPYLNEEDRPKDTAGWSAFGARLAEAGKPIQDAGLIFGWHNHDFEFAATPEGDLPQDLIAAASPDLMLELDLGWVARSGHDPAAWVRNLKGQLTAVHVKDIAVAGTCLDEDGWADVGHGIIDWPPVLQALKEAGVNHLVIEHDNPNDHTRFAARSLAALETFAEDL